MLVRRTSSFALAAMLAVASLAMTAFAQERKTGSDSTQTIGLSNAQVFQIQGLLGSQTRELQLLNAQVQSGREFLESALAENDPIRISRAVLALDAAEKALEN